MQNVKLIIRAMGVSLALAVGFNGTITYAQTPSTDEAIKNAKLHKQAAKEQIKRREQRVTNSKNEVKKVSQEIRAVQHTKTELAMHGNTSPAVEQTLKELHQKGDKAVAKLQKHEMSLKQAHENHAQIKTDIKTLKAVKAQTKALVHH